MLKRRTESPTTIRRADGSYFYTEAVMGRSYKDTLTDFEGVCVRISFDLTGCNRVILEPIVTDEMKQQGRAGTAIEIDTIRLMDINTGKLIDQPRSESESSPEIKQMTGGPTTRIER